MADPSLALIADAVGQQTPASSDFDLNPDLRAPATRALRPAAVLIGITWAAHGAEVLLTKRSSRLRHHPGQIAFPGGRQDPEDQDAQATALREAHEEVGLPSHLVRPLGALPPHATVTGYQVTPIVAEITSAFDPVCEVGEVAEVFTVPLRFLMEPAHFRIEHRRWQGTRRQFYVVPYGPYYIWGATARILKGLADRVQACR